VRQGFYWWEIDLSYYGLKALNALGLVRDLKPVPARILADGRRKLPDVDPPSPASAEAIEPASESIVLKKVA